MVKLPLDDEFPASFVADIGRVVRQMRDVHHAKVRLIRVPHEDLAPVLDRVVQHMHIPFMPVLYGVPVEFALTDGEVQVMCVQDDDTLLAVNEHGRQSDGQLVLATDDARARP